MSKEKVKQRICKNPKKDCNYVFEADQKTNVCPDCGYVNEHRTIEKEEEKSK